MNKSIYSEPVIEDSVISKKNGYFSESDSGNPVNLPMFLFPTHITPDLPLKVSDSAKELLSKAISLCRPRNPGFILGDQPVYELRELVETCNLLSSKYTIDKSTKKILDDQELSFDNFFGLRRSQSPDAFAIGIAWGIVATLEEINHPQSLVSAEIATLINGFYKLVILFFENFSSSASTPLKSERTSPIRPPMERWHNGHIIFVSLTGGLIFTHTRVITAIENNDFVSCKAALNDTSALFFASAAAMRLTGDMAPADYEQVRLAMSPPNVPEGFSGLFNCDHRQLLRLIKKLGTLLNKDLPDIAWEREHYWMALNTAYSAHRSVCQELVGRTPSLATASRNKEKPAHEMLESFARRALVLGGYKL